MVAARQTVRVGADGRGRPAVVGWRDGLKGFEGGGRQPGAQVDAVGEGAGDPGGVAFDGGRAAATPASGLAEKSAGAWVHGRN